MAWTGEGNTKVRWETCKIDKRSQKWEKSWFYSKKGWCLTLSKQAMCP